jgi:hypothetical protein
MTMLSAGRMLVLGVSLSMLVGCSASGKTGEGPGGEDLLVDPCKPDCCCRAKDNYYVRYGCSSLIQCVQDGGVCATKNLHKCQSEDPATSKLDTVERAVGVDFEPTDP